uniref:VPS9 domain-containing protein n=1 Tax=Glossina morsitans morsitans TaxID=37546 RepID=A0A1B0GA97_GLOMM
MSNFLIFHKESPVAIKWNIKVDPPSSARQLCYLSPCLILILTNDNCIYEGHFNEENNCMTFENLIQIGIEDMQFNKVLRRIYIVTCKGQVFFQFFDTDMSHLSSQWKQIVFESIESLEEQVVIKRVSCSAEGVLFVSRTDDIYALGKCGDHFRFDFDQPKLIHPFKHSVHVINLVGGDNFFIFLARKYLNESSNYTNEPQQYEKLPDLVCSDARTESSKHPLTNSVNVCDCRSQNENLEPNTQLIIDQGSALLQTVVYTFEASNRNLMGTRDHVKRDSLFALEKLKDIGICDISAGREHAIARSIDGRLYYWGSNGHRELLSSSTTEWVSENSSNLVESCCRGDQTILLTAQGELYENSKNIYKGGKDTFPAQVNTASFSLLCSEPLILYNGNQYKTELCNLRTHLQNQLKTMITFYKRYHQLNTLANKIVKELQEVWYQFKNVILLLISVLHSLEKFYRGDNNNPLELVFIKCRPASVKILEVYMAAYCDTYSINGFADADKTLRPTPTSCVDYNYQNLMKMFQQPFQISPYLLRILEQLQKDDEVFNDHIQAWEYFTRKNRIELELAESTRDFWLSNTRNTKIARFKNKDRRVILSSTSVPLKLLHSIGLTTQTFILFSDCLCHVHHHVTVYPLIALWLKMEENGIRLITPEKNFILTARTEHDKELWYDQLESSIKMALNLKEKAKVPEFREDINYSFTTNHSVYGGVNVKGNFSNGVMHGKCRLEFPNGKLYFGEVIHGAIEGYGLMYSPKVGSYKGSFRNGKFSGYGKLVISEKKIYEGYFRNGLFHGHGHFKQNDSVYIGEFQDNNKSGYGVLDYIICGDKYMGSFADNKRCGDGIYITSNGDYFEGAFVNDELTGKCSALFQNHSFYEGELTLAGPNGLGKYYMPFTNPLEELCEISLNESINNQQITGSALSGQLSGKWDQIHITSGLMEFNRTYMKYPTSLGLHATSNDRKWCALFINYEEELFGDLAKSTQFDKPLTFALWNRVIAFITKQREIVTDAIIDRELSLLQRKRNESRADFRNDFDAKFEKLSLNASLDFEKFELKKRSRSQDTLSITNDLETNIDLLSLLKKLEEIGSDDKSDILLSSENRNSNNLPSDFFESQKAVNDLTIQLKMDLIPQCGLTELNLEDLNAIKEYLTNAFKYRHHPFYHLNQRITATFYRSYGCWKMKPTPFLAKNALLEWESISQRVYKIIRKLFPALPEDYCVLESSKREVVSHITLLYPLLLSESVYSTLFLLYASKYSHKDELYRQNLLRAEKFDNTQLISALQLDRDLVRIVDTSEFEEAVVLLKQLKKKRNPMGMLTVIENCMGQVTKASQNVVNVFLSADIVMPLTLMLLLRAAIPHLGAELALLDDLTDCKNFQFEMNGIRGYCYTTLKASYEHLTTKLTFELK